MYFVKLSSPKSFTCPNEIPLIALRLNHRIPFDDRLDMKIDLDRIKNIDHCCTGCESSTECCCARYDILISEDEMQQILNIFPLAASYCPNLMQNGELLNVFEDTEDGQIRIDTDENELCVFAYRQKGLIWCALHSVALDLGVPVSQVKPFHCLLWPLAVCEETETVISIQHNALDFPCNRTKNSEVICKSLQETLELLF